eukprot:gene67200-biopygen49338
MCFTSPFMTLTEFDFHLPDDRIALRPASPRDSARLLLVTPGEPLCDLQVRDLPGLLRPGDVLVVNDTRVIPARLKGVRARGDRVSFEEMLEMASLGSKVLQVRSVEIAMVHRVP